MKKYISLIFALVGLALSAETVSVSFGSTRIALDPHHSYSATEAQLYTALYEGLYTYHPLTLEPVPGVARNFEVSEDGLVYRFYLRPDAYYWNGDRVTAEDFRESWLLHLNPEDRAEYTFLLDIIKGAREYRTGTGKREDVGISVPEEGVLEVTLNHPASHFLKILCHHSFSPVHSTFRENPDWENAPSVIGNGPFMLYSRSPEKYVLKKNQFYWDRRNVRSDEIIFLLSDDYQHLTDLFNAKEVLWASGNILYDKLDDTSTLQVFHQFATTYFYFVCDEDPWTDPRVRRALLLLVPWEDLRTEERYAVPTFRAVPEISGYPEVAGINSRDRETALKLLKEAGFPEGQGLPRPVFKIPESQEVQDLATAMATAWRDTLGLEAQFTLVPYGDYYNSIENRDYTIGLMSWIGDYADPLAFLQMWVSDSNLNKGSYSNPDYDNLIEEAMSLSGRERYNRMAKAEGLILEEGGIIPYKHSPSYNFVHADVLGGWLPNPLDIHPFKYLSYTKPPLPARIVRGN
ncbi:peptide ABC transporter substrate-binding protein [Marispirochaeta aestuarii]|uniref:peptide ABC transporter substrate-binding protein n=1 Tax=Marispirochaeta aestuarii TaxID=1963862 RepID=UPI0029C7630A|nr:peptide ABC transporter substrate-binding protein [Marispirochaeta aestuarii]